MGHHHTATLDETKPPHRPWHAGAVALIALLCGSIRPAHANPRSAVDHLTHTIAIGLGPVPDGTLVMTQALISDIQAPRTEALVAQLVKHVAGKLGPGVKYATAARTLEAAREQAQTTPAFILLQPQIRDGQMRLAADGYLVPRSVWARARKWKPGPSRHVFGHAPLDAELRGYLQPLRFGAPIVSQYEGADPGIVALACGDLDNDGDNDVISMTRRRLLRLALKDGQVLRRHEVRWAQASPLAGAPLRQPIGFVTLVSAAASADGQTYIDASLSDRAHGLRLDPQLQVRKTLPAFSIPSNSDALASNFLVSRSGEGQTLVALRTSKALVIRHHDEEHTIGPAGAQIAVADLDQDGAMDLLNSQDVLDPQQDALEVRSLLPSGTVKRRYRLPVPKGIEAVTTCPPDSTGVAPIVLASAGKLWVIR